jgi:hypothetical protein
MTSSRLAASIDRVEGYRPAGDFSPMDDVVALLVIAFGAVTALFAAGWVLVVERRRGILEAVRGGSRNPPGPERLKTGR